MKKGFLLALRLILGLAILVVLIRSLNPVQFWSLVKDLRVAPLLAASVFFLTAVLVSTFSWLVILHALKLRLSLWKAFQLNLISFFFNNLIPSGVGGDLWRGFAFSGPGVTLSSSMLSIFLERWMAFGALAAMSIISYSTCTGLLEAMNQKGLYLIFSLTLIAVFLLSLLLLPRISALGEKLFARYGAAWPNEEFACAMAQPWHLTVSALISLTSPLLEAVAFYFLALSLGLSPPLLSLFIFIPVFRLLHHLPLTVNAIGTQDLLAAYFFRFLGTSMEQALIISFLFHALKILVGCLGAPLLIFSTYKTRA